MEHQRQSVDWTGRILSILSLVVAIGIGGYVVSQREDAGTRDELLTKFGQELQGMITLHEEKRDALEKKFTDSLDQNDKRMTEWNQQLVSAINTFDSDAKRLLETMSAAETRASENRLADFQREMVELRRLAVSDPDADKTTDPGSTDDTETPDDTQLAVHTVLKVIPSDAKEEALIRIENSSDEDALIQRIQFKPESDFRVEASDASEDYSNTDTILVFAFDSSDNTSTKPGHHGLYDRKLTDPIRVPAGENMTLRIVITGRDHLGWGFAGQVRLDYNSKERLLVKTARVHFDDLDDASDDVDALSDLINEST